MKPSPTNIVCVLNNLRRKVLSEISSKGELKCMLFTLIIQTIKRLSIEKLAEYMFIDAEMKLTMDIGEALLRNLLMQRISLEAQGRKE